MYQEIISAELKLWQPGDVGSSAAGCGKTGLCGEIGISIVSDFVRRGFEPSDIGKLWKICHCGMLWEAIRTEDAIKISQQEILLYLRQTPSVYVLPEPLPAFYLGIEPACTLIPSPTLVDTFSQWRNNTLDRGISFLEIEPLYMISYDKAWMIVLTTENTPDGEQLCVLMKNFGMK